MSSPRSPEKARPTEKAPRRAPRSEKERAALAELIEVERAIAALEGRIVDNAEHIVTMRRDAQKRKAALEQLIASLQEQADRRRRGRPYKIVATIVAIGLLGGVGVLATRDVRARLAERDRAQMSARSAAKPFDGRFKVERSALGGDPISVASPAGTCSIAVAASPDRKAHVHVERDGATREADGSVGWCSCKAEEVKVTATGKAPLATLILSAPADAIGGADVLGALAPRPDATFAESVDRACAEAAFDAWASSHAPDLGKPEKLSREEQALAAQGLTLAGFGPPDMPFVLPRAPGDSCFVALSRGAGDSLSLRLKGGQRALSPKWGGLGFCAKDSSGLSVFREGSGEVALFSAPRARAGGLLGLREAAARAGVTVALWTPGDELEGDARAALDASGVSVAMSDYSGKRGAVLSFSTDARSLLVARDAGPDVACKPALDAGAVQAMCIEGRLGAFAPVGALPAGISRGPWPLWLALPEQPKRADLDRSLEVLAFARRMAAAGYELTTLVGATLTPDGLSVMARSREKEVVALVLSSKPPHLHTLSGGAPWTLADPRPTPLVPGAEVLLRATPKYDGHAQREFVVWRR